jgi:hypothetical protein
MNIGATSADVARRRRYQHLHLRPNVWRLAQFLPTAPQLLISLWLYAHSQGISSAREIARRCAFEPGFEWLCGLQPISHRTLAVPETSPL